VTIVARVSKVPGHLYYVDGAGRVMHGKKLDAANPTGTTVKRKPRHLYYVDGKGDVHERKAKGA